MLAATTLEPRRGAREREQRATSWPISMETGAQFCARLARRDTFVAGTGSCYCALTTGGRAHNILIKLLLAPAGPQEARHCGPESADVTKVWRRRATLALECEQRQT